MKEISLLLACDALRNVLTVEKGGVVSLSYSFLSLITLWVTRYVYRAKYLYVGRHTSWRGVSGRDYIPEEYCLDSNSPFWTCHA